MLTALALAAALTTLPAEPPRPLELVASTAQLRAPRVWTRAQRLLLQGAAGAALGVGTGLLGLATGVGAAGCPRDLVPTCRPADEAGFGLGWGLGVGAGVYLAGEAMDGEGSLSGMGLGTGVGATSALLVATVAPDLAVVALLALPLAGALTGYELGAEDAPGAQFRIRPSMKVGRDAVTVGVKGDF